MLAGELKDPRLEISVVVNEVRIAPDMRHARVFVGARGTEAEQAWRHQSARTRVELHSHEILERSSFAAFPIFTSH